VEGAEYATLNNKPTAPSHLVSEAGKRLRPLRN
jgi:hypothetical protein